MRRSQATPQRVTVILTVALLSARFGSDWSAHRISVGLFGVVSVSDTESCQARGVPNL